MGEYLPFDVSKQAFKQQLSPKLPRQVEQLLNKFLYLSGLNLSKVVSYYYNGPTSIMLTIKLIGREPTTYVFTWLEPENWQIQTLDNYTMSLVKKNLEVQNESE